MIGQGVDVVSAIAEDAGISVDVTDFRLSGDDAFKARPGCGAHLMVLCALKNFEISLYGPEAFGRNRLYEGDPRQYRHEWLCHYRRMKRRRNQVTKAMQATFQLTLVCCLGVSIS